MESKSTAEVKRERSSSPCSVPPLLLPLFYFRNRATVGFHVSGEDEGTNQHLGEARSGYFPLVVPTLQSRRVHPLYLAVLPAEEP